MNPILNLPMQPNDAGAATIRDYLKALLKKLWNEEDGFSGKRPFGNSGWQYDLYPPLIKAGIVTGTLDKYGHINEIDQPRANELIIDAIGDL